MKKLLVCLLTGVLAVCTLTSCTEQETEQDKTYCAECSFEIWETDSWHEYYNEDNKCVEKICETCYKHHINTVYFPD